MIDPQKCAAKIVLNDPALAESLLDLLVWAKQPNLEDNNDYDEILSMLYGKLQHARDSRDKYLTDRAA